MNKITNLFVHLDVKLREITLENDLTKYDQNETKTDELAT
jgi:hypothetical protein